MPARRGFAPAITFVLALLPAASAPALEVRTLDALLPGGADAAGIGTRDWRYSGFTFRSTGAISVDPSQVRVLLREEPSVASLGFVWETDVPSALGGAEAAFDVGYTLEGLFPWGVSGGLRFNGAVPAQGPGNASVTVVETITLDDGRRATLNVFNDGPGRLEDDNSDFSGFGLTMPIRRDNHVTLVAGSGGGPVALSFVNNLVEPLPDFPEPASAAILSGVAPLLLRRRRHVV